MSADRDRQPFTWAAADVRRLRILSSRLVTGIFAGEYRSAFRGRGIEFEEVREYQPGDDIRNIDWNVTARAGRPFVKQYVEEREMTVMILLDLSPSLACPTPRGTKSRVAAEIAALLAYAATRSNDRVGLMTFSDRIERYIPPAKGGRHAQRLVAELQRQAPSGQGTDLAGALNYLERVQRRGAILFLISDFLSDDFSLPLAAAARRHDVVAISVTDPLDDELPGVGLLQVADAESGMRRLIDSSDAAVRTAYRNLAARRRAGIGQVCADAGVGHLEVASDASPAKALARFFHDRRRRRRR
jgi:uncharacterized protein (DUF58 family)